MPGRYLLAAVIAIAAILCVRIEYKSLGWGGYWSIDIVSPWTGRTTR